MLRDPHNLTRAFVTYVRPLLGYCIPVWSPHFKSDIETIENVQRVFTRKLFRLCKLAPADHEHRLHFLGLPRLELRGIYFDLVMHYKITNGLVVSNLRNALQYITYTRTRGHCFKLYLPFVHKFVFSSSFIKRVSRFWNSLSDSCFDVKSLFGFKRKLYAINFGAFMKGRV